VFLGNITNNYLKKKKRNNILISNLKLTLQDRVLGPTTWTGFTERTGYHEELELLDEEGDSE
jgi:hypothetical protein